MKKFFIVLMCTTIFMAAALESRAASARVRCRVESGRLRIQVDGQDLSKGTYGAKVKNTKTGAVVKTEANKVKTVTIAPDDVDLDFDSTANAADLDSFVPLSFAKGGDTVRASVINIKKGVTVAAASTTCVNK